MVSLSFSYTPYINRNGIAGGRRREVGESRSEIIGKGKETGIKVGKGIERGE